MHVLPLPFGLALALIPRREAETIRRKEQIRTHFGNTVWPREKVLTDLRYFNNVRGHI
jgi:hypothetical protein